MVLAVDIGTPATSNRFMPGCASTDHTPANAWVSVSPADDDGGRPSGASRSSRATASIRPRTAAVKIQ